MGNISAGKTRSKTFPNYKKSNNNTSQHKTNINKDFYMVYGCIDDNPALEGLWVY